MQADMRRYIFSVLFFAHLNIEQKLEQMNTLIHKEKKLYIEL